MTGSSRRRRFRTAIFSAFRTSAARGLSALSTDVRRPRRAAATAVMTAPPPTVRSNDAVLISSPGLGRWGRPKNTRSSKDSPTTTRSNRGTRRTLARHFSPWAGHYS